MKKSTLYCIIGGLVLFCIVLLTPMYLQETVNTSAAITSEQQTDEPLYTIRVYHNMLAIYQGNSDTPWRVTDIHLSSLREYDQKLMQQGFPLYSQQDLTMFLEDYGS
ncbi:MAG: hypothetical protein Q4F79_01360 [Eubacteriales bacterium]|nr:hypothetical protein [Eubacteriales bacterium]